MKILRCPTRKRSGDCSKNAYAFFSCLISDEIPHFATHLPGSLARVETGLLPSEAPTRRPSELEEPVGFFSTSCVGPQGGWGNSDCSSSPMEHLGEIPSRHFGSPTSDRSSGLEGEKNSRTGILRRRLPAVGTPEGTKYPKMRD